MVGKQEGSGRWTLSIGCSEIGICCLSLGWEELGGTMRSSLREAASTPLEISSQRLKVGVFDPGRFSPKREEYTCNGNAL